MQRTIVEERTRNAVVMDVFSRLIQERMVFIDDYIDDELANGVIAQILYLNSLSDKTIHIYINSEGGDVLSGLAIYDISKIIRAPIRTICVGKALSMGAVLMFMGSERCGLPHSRIMLHQVVGGVRDNLIQMKISVAEAEKLQNDLYQIIEEKTTLKNLKELLYFDKWFSAQEALESGILTKIL